MNQQQHAGAVNNKSWGFMFNPMPKQIQCRMRAANISAAAAYVYMHIVESLNGQTKDGFSIPQTDSYIAQELSISQWVSRTARRELVNADLIGQFEYRVNGKRVVGTWIFRLKHTEPCGATTKKKHKKRRERNRAKAQEADQETSRPGNTETKGYADHENTVETSPPFSDPCDDSLHSECGDDPQEHGADCYINSEGPNALNTEFVQVLAHKNTYRKERYKQIYKDNLSLKPPLSEQNESPVEEEVEETERDGLADIFYQECLKRRLNNSRKRRKIEAYFAQIVQNVESDNRVESVNQARDVLIDAFSRVKRIVTPIWAYTVMETGYGESAIEQAIQAQHFSANDHSSVHPPADAPSDSKDTKTYTEPFTSYSNICGGGDPDSDAVEANSSEGSAEPDAEKMLRTRLAGKASLSATFSVTPSEAEILAAAAEVCERRGVEQLADAKVMKIWFDVSEQMAQAASGSR